MTPDTPSHYGTISRALHWSMAIAIACMYLLALAWRVSGHTETLIPVHKALGTLLLILVLARIFCAIAAEQRPSAVSRTARLLLPLTVGHILMTAVHRAAVAKNPATHGRPPRLTGIGRYLQPRDHSEP